MLIGFIFGLITGIIIVSILNITLQEDLSRVEKDRDYYKAKSREYLEMLNARKGTMMGMDRCVACNDIIAEGSQLCWRCNKQKEDDCSLCKHKKSIKCLHCRWWRVVDYDGNRSKRENIK